MVQSVINVCINVLEWLISLFPTITFFQDFSSAINSLSKVLYESSAIIPFSDLFICIGLISSFYIVLFGIKCINWIIHRIPFIN